MFCFRPSWANIHVLAPRTLSSIVFTMFRALSRIASQKCQKYTQLNKSIQSFIKSCRIYLIFASYHDDQDTGRQQNLWDRLG